MDCADCTISLDTSLAKLARVDIGMSLTLLRDTQPQGWLHYLTRHFVSQAIDTYEVLIPVSWQRAFLTTALVIASAEYAISLDTSLAKLARVIDIGMSLTLLAEWLKPTKCWHTTALVIADGLRWLHYLTRHTVSQACKGDWYWNELDIVSRVIETYEVLTHNRKGDWYWNELDTVSRVIETYEVLTHNRKGDSRWTALIALSHSTLR